MRLSAFLEAWSNLLQEGTGSRPREFGIEFAKGVTELIKHHKVQPPRRNLGGEGQVGPSRGEVKQLTPRDRKTGI